MMKKKLILISGSPCVGKTAVGEKLFESYDNSAYLDAMGTKACPLFFQTIWSQILNMYFLHQSC